MTETNINLVWAWAVKCSVCMICWTFLAIHFGKWWIALFSALTMSDLRLDGEKKKEEERKEDKQ